MTHRTQAGFSLIETMVAFGILAVGMIAVSTLVTTAMQLDRQSISKRDAVTAAMNKLEELRTDGADTDVTLSGYYTSMTPSPTVTTVNTYHLKVTDIVAKEVKDGVERATGFVIELEMCAKDDCTSAGAEPASGWPAQSRRVEMTLRWCGQGLKCEGSPSTWPYSTRVSSYIIVPKAAL